jgi:transcriptional regulator with XRE-family HTH domain
MGRISIIEKRLRQAKKRTGISSQAKIGLLAKLHESSVSPRMNNYFKGRNAPKLSTMTHIAAVLKTPVPYFYCEDDDLADLILKFGTLDEAQKKQLLAFAAKL